MKTFVWPTGSQNTRSSAFDWDDLSSILNNNRTSKRSKWSNVGFEEVEEAKAKEAKAKVDPKVQECVELGKAALPAAVYQIKMTSGLNDREIIVLLKAVVSAVKPIAEAGMTNRLNGIIEQATGYKISNQFNLSDQQMVQAVDLMIEFLNSKL